MNTSTLRRLAVVAVAVATLAGCDQVVCTRTAAADSWSIIDADDNTQIMQEVADALADVEAIYGTGPLIARTGWLGSPAIFAAARGNAIVINKAWSTGSYDVMAATVNADIASGFHNPGCAPARTIALHEAAHVINNKRGGVPARQAMLTAGTGPRPDLRGSLSGYSFDVDGSVDPGEALAEAFQAVVCGSAGPEEYELYDMLVH